MYTIVVLSALVAATLAVTNPPFPTGKPLATVPPNICVNALCAGKNDGNYAIVGFPHHFVQCANGLALCQACPDYTGLLFFNEVCDQCLGAEANAINQCATTKPTGTPLPPPNCPSSAAEIAQANAQCRQPAADFCGNRVDFRNNPSNNPTKVFLMCYMGNYVDCMECQRGLFHELVNWQGQSDIYGYCDA